MNIFNILTLAGGLAMFLYGMRLMGDALKESSSGTLKAIMEKVTNNPVKAFLLGVFVTALIQSSTATIVITSGLVGAGILTLHQSLGIIIGANVGTTVTGQIIRLLDLDSSATAWMQIFKPSTLAPVALIIGIVILMSGKPGRSKSVGNIAMGFGILFMGLMTMTNAVSAFSESPLLESIFTGLGNNPLLGYIAGAGIAFVLQSSSATVGILQAFSVSGLLTFKAVYPVIIGIYLGDCVTTAIVCSIGARAEARRVGIVNILFNLSETVLVFAGVTLIHSLGGLQSLWNATVNSGIIANTNTTFNLCCAVLLFPLLGVYEKLSRRIVRDEPEPENHFKDNLEALSPAFMNTPALALRSCYDILLTTFRSSRENIRKANSLLERFDPAVYAQVMEEEERIDQATDAVSQYIVALLPKLHEGNHVGILSQYHKVVSEFERLGDHAVNVADGAADMHRRGVAFTEAAIRELGVLERIQDEILDLTEKTFEKRDVAAAYRIEPLTQVTEDVIDVLKENHLKRMAAGTCDIYADASFMNLLVDFKRIADVCSNVGVATVIRVQPELTEQEHTYFEGMHAGHDEEYNEAYHTAHDRFFSELEEAEAADAGTVPAPHRP